MGAEGITDFLQLNLNAFALVEDDEYKLLKQFPSFRVSDWLVDGGESDVAASACGSKRTYSLVETTPVMEEKRMSRSG
jgi:hypothetical protein